MKNNLYKLLYLVKRIFRIIIFFFKSNRQIFTHFYFSNKWGNIQSKSGKGSTITATKKTRKVIIKVLDEFKIKAFIDLPCGDFNWMKLINFNECIYIGCDIVEQLVSENLKRFKSKNVNFITLDMINDPIPKGELIFCRDCLVHLSNKNVMKTIKNFKKSGAKYLLTTHFPNQKRNVFISNGMFRRINLTNSPFNLPPPIRIFDDNDGKVLEKQKYKSLALWNIEQLKF